MFDDFKEWLEDMWYLICDIGSTFWDLLKAIAFLIAHLIYDLPHYVFVKCNNFAKTRNLLIDAMKENFYREG